MQNMKNKTSIWLGFQPGSQMDPHTLLPHPRPPLSPLLFCSDPGDNLQWLLMCKMHIHKANQPAIIHLCRTQSITHLANIRQGGIAAVSTRPSVKPRLSTTLDTTSVITQREKSINKPQLQVQSAEKDIWTIPYSRLVFNVHWYVLTM